MDPYGKNRWGTAMVDIRDFVNPGETYTFIRLTDLKGESAIPGADVDAVAAIGGAVRLQPDSSVLAEFGKYGSRFEAEALLRDMGMPSRLPQMTMMKADKGSVGWNCWQCQNNNREKQIPIGPWCRFTP